MQRFPPALLAQAVSACGEAGARWARVLVRAVPGPCAGTSCWRQHLSAPVLCPRAPPSPFARLLPAPRPPCCPAQRGDAAGRNWAGGDEGARDRRSNPLCTAHAPAAALPQPRWAVLPRLHLQPHAPGLAMLAGRVPTRAPLPARCSTPPSSARPTSPASSAATPRCSTLPASCSSTRWQPPQRSGRPSSRQRSARRWQQPTKRWATGASRPSEQARRARVLCCRGPGRLPSMGLSAMPGCRHTEAGPPDQSPCVLPRSLGPPLRALAPARLVDSPCWDSAPLI